MKGGSLNMLSKNLKIFRKRKGLTQENVAEALNIGKRQIKWCS